MAIQPEYVHVAISIPLWHAPARAIGQLRGASSRLLRQRDSELVAQAFGWQHEYGVVSLSAREAAYIIGHNMHQDERHAEARLIDQLERAAEDFFEH